MKYIKVTNNVNEVSRIGLEKLGLSTKRENQETIGQFGSGIKFAPIAAIRKGMEWYFTGADSKGKYVLEYIIEEDDGVPCVFYKYQDYVKPSSFTADAGIFSWENDFQIYREVVANAMDESKISGKDWKVEIVDCEEIVSIDGEFSVYFTLTDSMLEVYKNHNKYFCNNRTPVYSNGFCNLYEPIDNNFRVYCKGVLVHSSERKDDDLEMNSLSGIFDYEINNLALNEERSVKSTWDMGYEILKFLSSIQDKNIIGNVISKIVNHNTENRLYELDGIPSSLFTLHYFTSNEWVNAFTDSYEGHVILKDSDSTINVIKTIESRGYKALPVTSENGYSFLSARDIPNVFNIVGESFKYDYSMNIREYPALQMAVNIVESVIDDIDFYGILGVYSESENDNEALGLTVTIKDCDEDSSKVILINSKHADSGDIKKIISTLIHEWDHYSSNLTDGNMEGRMFRDLADTRMADLIWELYKVKNKSMV